MSLPGVLRLLPAFGCFLELKTITASGIGLNDIDFLATARLQFISKGIQ